MLVLLTGKAGSGKNAVADALTEGFQFEQWSFAAALRDEVLAHIEQDDWPEGSVPPGLNASEIAPEDIFHKPTMPEARRLLQWYGTNYRRAQDRDYWVQKLSESLYLAHTDHPRPEGSNTVITDCRFPNEAIWGLKRGGYIVRVDRPEKMHLVTPLAHVSECVERLPYHYLLRNDGTLRELRNRAWEMYYDLRRIGERVAEAKAA